MLFSCSTVLTGTRSRLSVLLLDKMLSNKSGLNSKSFERKSKSIGKVSKVASVSGAFPIAAGLSTFIWLLMASDMRFLVLGSVEPEKHNKEKN
jgi:hypothetical protein